MSEVKPWSYYEKYGSDAAAPGRTRRLHSEVKGGTVAGALLMAVATIRFEAGFETAALMVIAGAILGATGGLITGRIAQRRMSRTTSEMLYASDWARAHGLVYYGSISPPSGAPYMTSGESRTVTHVIRGDFDGLLTTFYNVTYLQKREGSDPVPCRFKVMQLVGPQLSIGQMSLLRQGAGDDLHWKSQLRGRFAPERLASLESVEFNQRFELRIGTAADEVAIRQIFDPATIDALLRLPATLSSLFYSSGSWWFIEKDHYLIQQLDDWLPKQQLAAEAVRLLSGVQ